MAQPAKGPTAPIPAKASAPAADVKEPDQVSSELETPEVKASEDETPEIDEADLKTLEEEKKIPYGRFKEKVDETKDLKNQIERLRTQAEEQTRRAVEDAELRTQARLRQKQEEAEDLDDTTREFRRTNSEISTLKTELAQLRAEAENRKLQSEIDSLVAKYPDADPIAVMGWKKVKGKNADLEELMAFSHNQNIERVEKRFKALIEHKRAKAKAVVPTRETQSGTRLKESEKPKSMAEAKALVKKYFGVS